MRAGGIRAKTRAAEEIGIRAGLWRRAESEGGPESAWLDAFTLQSSEGVFNAFSILSGLRPRGVRVATARGSTSSFVIIPCALDLSRCHFRVVRCRRWQSEGCDLAQLGPHLPAREPSDTGGQQPVDSCSVGQVRWHLACPAQTSTREKKGFTQCPACALSLLVTRELMQSCAKTRKR